MIMDAIPSLVLVFGVAFVWLGLTVIVLLRLRRRRGSSLVATAAPPAGRAGTHSRKHWRLAHPLTGSAPAGRHRGRKARG